MTRPKQTARKAEYGRSKARKPKSRPPPPPPAFVPSRDVSMPKPGDDEIEKLLEEHRMLLEDTAEPIMRKLVLFAEHGFYVDDNNGDTDSERINLESHIQHLASLTHGEPWAIQAIIEMCKINIKAAQEQDDFECYSVGCAALDKDLLPLVKSRLVKGTQKELFAICRRVFEVRKMADSLIWTDESKTEEPSQGLYKQERNLCFKVSAGVLSTYTAIHTGAMIVEKVAGPLLPPELTGMIEDFYAEDARLSLTQVEAECSGRRSLQSEDVYFTAEEVAEYHRKKEEAQRRKEEAKQRREQERFGGKYIRKSVSYPRRQTSPEL